jgi:hypothetical protein
MRLLITMLALTRLMVLKRQWREVLAVLNQFPENNRMLLAAFVYGEAQRAAKHPMPRFYGSNQTSGYRPWGDALDSAIERVRSNNTQLQMKGLAMWLAVVYHETRETGHPGLEALHQEVAGHFTQLRDLHQRVLAIRMAA